VYLGSRICVCIYVCLLLSNVISFKWELFDMFVGLALSRTVTCRTKQPPSRGHVLRFMLTAMTQSGVMRMTAD